MIISYLQPWQPNGSYYVCFYFVLLMPSHCQRFVTPPCYRVQTHINCVRALNNSAKAHANFLFLWFQMNVRWRTAKHEHSHETRTNTSAFTAHVCFLWENSLQPRHACCRGGPSSDMKEWSWRDVPHKKCSFFHLNVGRRLTSYYEVDVDGAIYWLWNNDTMCV